MNPFHFPCARCGAPTPGPEFVAEVHCGHCGATTPNPFEWRVGAPLILPGPLATLAEVAAFEHGVLRVRPEGEAERVAGANTVVKVRWGTPETVRPGAQAYHPLGGRRWSAGRVRHMRGGLAAVAHERFSNQPFFDREVPVGGVLVVVGVPEYLPAESVLSRVERALGLVASGAKVALALALLGLLGWVVFGLLRGAGAL